MIIDRRKSDQSRYPETIDGKVLLKEARLSDGRLIGYHVADIEAVEKWKQATPQERAAAGWDRYQAVLDSLSDQEIQQHKARLAAEGRIEPVSIDEQRENARARIREDYRKSPPATDAERIRALEIIMGLREPEIDSRKKDP